MTNVDIDINIDNHFNQHDSIESKWKVQDWHYLAEGGVNTVFTYEPADIEQQLLNNDEHYKLVGKVLKVSKHVIAAAAVEGCHQVEIDNIVAHSHSYVEHCMKPLLGSQHVNAGEIVHLSSTFVLQLFQHTVHSRPLYRVERHPIPSKLSALTIPAVLLPDYTQLQHSNSIKSNAEASFCIELKPKWGFLPSSPFISSETSIKRQVCRYCMHQYWKLQKGEIFTCNQFCPLDLYSGDKQRTERAVDELLMNPQNNFRFFVRTTKTIEVVDWSDVTSVQNALQRLFQSNDPYEHLLCQFRSIVESLVLSPSIQQLFQRIALLQQYLDRWDVEGIFPIYQSLLDSSIGGEDIWKWPDSEVEAEEMKHCAHHSDMYVSLLEEVAPILERACSTVQSSDLNSLTPLCGHWYRDTNVSNNSLASDPIVPAVDSDSLSVDAPLHVRKQWIRQFLIATTLKDLSCMITLKPNSNQSTGTSLTAPFHYSLALIDLDQKEFTKLPHYFKQDRTIVNAYLAARPLNATVVGASS